MNRFTIKELERYSGIKAHTIRIWEKRYRLLSPGRTDTNIRYYTDEDLRRLLNVSLLNKNGLKISHISQLSQDEVVQKLHNLREENAYDYYVDRFIMATMHFNHPDFFKIFDECEQKFGFKEVVMKILYPLLNRIGMLWGTQELSSAHEHFVSNIVRMKLLHAINNQTEWDFSKPKCLLFLHQHENHEIGLMFAWFLLRQAGYPVTFLGANVPLDGLQQAIEEIKPEWTFTLFISPMEENEPVAYLKEVHQLDENMKLYFSVAPNWDIPKSENPSIILMESVDRFQKLVGY